MWPLVTMQAMNQDIVLSSQDLDVIIALVDVSGHPDWHGPSGGMILNANMSLGCSQDPGIHSAFDDSTSYRHQCRPWVL